MQYFTWILLAIAWTVVLVQDQVHLKLKQIKGDEWKLIGRVQGVLAAQGPWVEVTKWSSAQGIQLRFFLNHFDQKVEDKLPALQTIELPRGFDGHLWVNQVYANLAILDTDQEGPSEVIVPYYDLKLNPRLFVYRYDPVIREFIRVNDQGL